jgi:hypothetical protein
MGALALTLATLLAADAEAGSVCQSTDPDGVFLTCFDPDNRAYVAPGGQWGLAAPGSFALEAGIDLENNHGSHREPRLLWSVEHQLLDLHLDFAAGQPEGRAVLYQGVFLRHLEEGYVLIPTPSPIRLRFPFDVGMSARLGDYQRWATPNIQRLEVGEVSALLDVARDPLGCQRLALGPSIAYALQRGPDGRTVSEVQPLTGVEALARWQSRDGLWTAQARAAGGWEVVLPGESGWRMWLRAAAERVLFAVNDQPVGLRLSVEGLDARVPQPQQELRVTLGLVAAWDG